MTATLPKFIATSVVRGSQQGESHDGVYTVDFEKQEVLQHVDWNTGEIDFEGRNAVATAPICSSGPSGSLPPAMLDICGRASALSGIRIASTDFASKRASSMTSWAF